MRLAKTSNSDKTHNYSEMHLLTGSGLDDGRISAIQKSNAYLYLLRDTKKQTFPGRPPTEYGDGSREVVMISIYPPR